ncbi:FAD-dependent oxidoreductase [Nocardioides sp. NPDC087217]|uniref:FAD-dependent oxidoreductase n=1 Tax=Nocardioides sp. NPDC087217 TaxID=3364335 RepID=UPI0037FB46C7
MKAEDTAIDVLIAGAGPSGSALAIDLVRRGLDVRIVDKAPHSFEGSRAKGLQPRTLEVLDDLGVLSRVVHHGSLYPKLGIHLGRAVIPWSMMKNRAATADVPYPNTWLIPQFATDAALHARLVELGGKVEYGTEITEFTQDATAVTATLATDGGVEHVTARYLVGTDGGASTTRTTLGIDFIGSTDEQDRILIVDATTTGLSRNRWHMWPRLRGGFVAACPLPDSDLFQWMVRLAPDENPPTDLAEINTRIRAHTHASGVELQDVRWRSVFRPNIRLASHYRQGRVFIAGDAAHVHTPAGAQGLNTGIQDAYNLGWKLGQVLAGAPDTLLDSYEAERQPIAAGVLGLSTKKYEAIGKLDPASIRRGKDEQQLGITYRGGPLAATAEQTTKQLDVGDRAPDAVMVDAEGRPARMFDAYRGPHFTAVAYGDGAARALNQIQWPATGAALRTVAVDALSSTADLVLTDGNGSFRESYGVSEDTLLLVRPDGYLASISSGDMISEAEAAVSLLRPLPRERGSGARPRRGSA